MKEGYRILDKSVQELCNDLIDLILIRFKSDDKLESLLINVDSFIEDNTSQVINRRIKNTIASACKCVLIQNEFKCRWNDNSFIEIVRYDRKFQHKRTFKSMFRII